MKLLHSLLLLVLVIASTEAAIATVCFRYDNPLCTPQGMRKIRFVVRNQDSIYKFDVSRDCDFHSEKKMCGQANAVCVQPGYRNNKGGFTVFYVGQQSFMPVEAWGKEYCSGHFKV